jgi:pimeloyl-ACP methyl ester carboxylesterase
MKVYEFGADTAPVILLLPGTCCHWKSNFGQVIPLLQRDFRVLCVSYDGFDETESTEFPTMLAETEKIEAYILKNCGGHIRAAYGCSLGGSFVGLLACYPYKWAHLVKSIIEQGV